MLLCICLSPVRGKIKHRLRALLSIDGLKHVLLLYSSTLLNKIVADSFLDLRLGFSF